MTYNFLKGKNDDKNKKTSNYLDNVSRGISKSIYYWIKIFIYICIKFSNIFVLKNNKINKNTFKIVISNKTFYIT